MHAEISIHELSGCAPVPLACYLKALGILRIVSAQADRSTQGWWGGDVFHLRTKLDKSALRDFFLNDYRPTPIVAPWNGGSGFYPKDNRAAITALSAGDAERTAVYRESISVCRDVCEKLGLDEKPGEEMKQQLLIACRGNLPDESITWLDAAFVLTNEGPKYPPLLGTGGNDGRLEFTNNLMQRLLDLVDPETGLPTASAASWWEDAFFGRAQDDLQKGSILGQFDPGAIDRPVNPWDYVLMMEGALVFAAASTRRLGAAAKGTMSCPFSVRSTPVGYGSAADSDEASSRAELWLPLWSRRCTYPELENLFSEGRASVHGRAARNGVDFARAVSTLGTDRGISQFARYGFQARYGLAYFAVPFGRFSAGAQPQVDLLADPELDAWLDRFRRAASSDGAPSSAVRALRRLDAAILDLCQHGESRLPDVLIALGEAESSLAASKKWRTDAFLRPVPLLSPQWLTDCDDDSSEFRLAASLAGIYSPTAGRLRQHLEPVELRGSGANWTEDASAASNVVWSRGSLESNLIAVLERRSVEVIRSDERASDRTLVFPGHSCCYPSLDDLAAFLGGRTNDAQIDALVRGLILLDWKQIEKQGLGKTRSSVMGDDTPDALFTILKLCHTPYPVREKFVRLDPTIVRLAAAGRLGDAVPLAARRLIAASLEPAIWNGVRNGNSSRRVTAALLFPVRHADLEQLATSVLVSKRER